MVLKIPGTPGFWAPKSRDNHNDVPSWDSAIERKHLGQYPDLHTLFWDATKAAGASKKSLDTADAQKTIDLVARIDKIFWETKKG